MPKKTDEGMLDANADQTSQRGKMQTRTKGEIRKEPVGTVEKK